MDISANRATKRVHFTCRNACLFKENDIYLIDGSEFFTKPVYVTIKHSWTKWPETQLGLAMHNDTFFHLSDLVKSIDIDPQFRLRSWNGYYSDDEFKVNYSRNGSDFYITTWLSYQGASGIKELTGDRDIIESVSIKPYVNDSLIEQALMG